jgi:hypothetical protein
MGSTTSLFRCSKKMDSYIAGTRQKYWSDWRGWWRTQVKTTSRNTIKIVLGTEFDLTIAQTQIKDWKDSISKRWDYLASTRTKLDIPLGRTKSDRDFVFQLSKLLFKINQLVQGIQHGFLKKRAIQRTSLLMNLTNRSCENKAMLLERQLECHEPLVCHWVQEGNLALQGKRHGHESFGMNLTLWPKMCAWIKDLATQWNFVWWSVNQSC